MITIALSIMLLQQLNMKTFVNCDPYTKLIKKSRSFIYEGIDGNLIEQYIYMKQMFYIASLFQRNLVIVNTYSYSYNLCDIFILPYDVIICVKKFKMKCNDKVNNDNVNNNEDKNKMKRKEKMKSIDENKNDEGIEGSSSTKRLRINNNNNLNVHNDSARIRSDSNSNSYDNDDELITDLKSKKKGVYICHRLSLLNAHNNNNNNYIGHSSSSSSSKSSSRSSSSSSTLPILNTIDATMFGFHMKLSNDSLNQVNYIKETLDNHHMNSLNDVIVISYDINDIYHDGSCFDSINIDKKFILKSHSSSSRHSDGSGSSDINHSISESSSNVEKLQQQLHSDNIDGNTMNQDQISQLSSSCLQFKVLLQELKQLLTPFCNFIDNHNNDVSMTEESLVNNIKISNNYNNSIIHHQQKLFTLPNLYFIPKKKIKSNLCYLLDANNATNTERSFIHSIFNGFLKSYRDIFPDDIQYSYIKSESIELMEIGLMLYSHSFLDYRYISDTSDKSSSSSSSSSSSKYIRNDLIEYERRHMNNEHCTSSSSSSSITRIKTNNVVASAAAAVVVDSNNYDNSFCALLKHNQITIPIYDNNEYNHDQASLSSSSLTTATTRSNTTVESIALLLLFIIKSRLLLLMIGMTMTFCIIYFFRFIYYRCKCRFLKVT